MAAQGRPGAAGDFGKRMKAHNALDMQVSLAGQMFVRMDASGPPCFGVPIHVDNFTSEDLDVLIEEVGEEHFKKYPVPGSKTDGNRGFRVTNVDAIRKITRFHDLSYTRGLGHEECKVSVHHKDIAVVIPPLTLTYNAQKRMLLVRFNWAQITQLGRVNFPLMKNVSDAKKKKRAQTAARQIQTRIANAIALGVQPPKVRATKAASQRRVAAHKVWPPPHVDMKPARARVVSVPAELVAAEYNLDPRMLETLAKTEWTKLKLTGAGEWAAE